MTLETRVTTKRLATLLCSIRTIVCYSYLLEGVGGYLFGRGRPVTATLGFVSGTILACLAMLLWKSYLADVDRLAERKKTERGRREGNQDN